MKGGKNKMKRKIAFVRKLNKDLVSKVSEITSRTHLPGAGFPPTVGHFVFFPENETLGEGVLLRSYEGLIDLNDARGTHYSGYSDYVATSEYGDELTHLNKAGIYDIS
jgi:hypothetical protein